MNHRILENTPSPEPHSAESRPDDEPTRPLGDLLPIWLLKWGLATLLGFGVAALALATVGLFAVWTVTLLGVPSTLWIGRLIPSRQNNPVPAAVGFLVVLLAGVVCVYGWIAPHEHILTGRDSGTYVATAAWIANEGTLWMNVGDRILDGTEVTYESIGFPSLGDRADLRPQFLHMWPSLMAYAAAATSGVDGFFLVTPLVAAIGILALFAFARRLLSAWIALFATVLVATTMPFVYFYRAPFSETLAFTFLFGGLWALEEARERHSLRFATAAGAFIGAVSVVRIDGIVVLLGLTAYLMLTEIQGDIETTSQPTQLDVVKRSWNIAASMLVVATLDGAIFAPHYLSDHGSLIAAVLVLILVTRVLGRPFGRIYRKHRVAMANTITTLSGAFLVYAGLVRPYVAEPTRWNIYGIEPLQLAAGVAVEPLRSYAELSVRWLVWYLGVPLVVLGLTGLVVEMRRVLLSPRSPGGPFVAVAIVFTLLYVYRPSINPDHIWAMRRFMPLVIPALVVLALVLAARSAQRLGRWRSPAMVMLCVVLILPVSLATARSGLEPEFKGAGQDMVRACDTLGEGSVLVFVGESAGARLSALGPPLRGVCGVVVAAEDPNAPLSHEAMEALSQAASVEERSLWWVGGPPEEAETTTIIDREYQYLGLSLFEPPRDWASIGIHLSSWRQEP